jgi:hypothetical protein
MELERGFGNVRVCENYFDNIFKASTGFTSQSGPYYTMHADFWNTWVQSRLETLTDNCIRASKDCHIIGVTTTDV